jgi:AcrR family transcriptional regulator
MHRWDDIGLRAAVLEAALTMLVREGYERLSMRKIANAVGCSVSSIYLYFANKDELIHSLMDRGFEEWYQVVQERVVREAPPQELLEVYCREYIEFGLKNPELYEIMYVFHNERLSRYPKKLWRRARRPMEYMLEVLRLCDPRGVRSEAEARITAQVIFGILHGVVSAIIARRVDIRIDQEQYIELSIRSAVSLAEPRPMELPEAMAG